MDDNRYVIGILLAVAFTALYTWLFVAGPPAAWKEWSEGLVPLVAAFAGAWLAFRYNIQQKENEVRQANIAAGNAALFTLFQQLNFLSHYQIDIVEPARKSKQPYLDLHATLPYPEDEPAVRFGSLDFLLKRKAAMSRKLLN